MTYSEREVFIEDLISNVKEDIIKINNNLPNTWDGKELRELIANRFKEVAIKGILSGKRLKDFKNYCLVNNI